MSASFSVSELLSDLAADTASINLDFPDGGYDRLHAVISSLGILPESKRGRLVLVALMVLASRIAKQKLGPLGPIANFFNEVGEDGVREEAKRILTEIRSAQRTHRHHHRRPAATTVVGDALGAVNDFFFPWMRVHRGVSS
jgi:hypothetical protein